MTGQKSQVASPYASLPAIFTRKRKECFILCVIEELRQIMIVEIICYFMKPIFLYRNAPLAMASTQNLNHLYSKPSTLSLFNGAGWGGGVFYFSHSWLTVVGRLFQKYVLINCSQMKPLLFVLKHPLKRVIASVGGTVPWCELPDFPSISTN